MTRKPSKEKCIIEGCDRRQLSRGLCYACAQAFRRSVLMQEVSEEEAIRLGLVWPKRREPFAKTNPWSERLKAVKQP